MFYLENQGRTIICLWYVSIVATCIAVHFAVCHALYNNKNKKIGKNRCLAFLNDLVLVL